jgi:hypothetical protein
VVIHEVPKMPKVKDDNYPFLFIIEYPVSRPNSFRRLFNEQAVINPKNIILKTIYQFQVPEDRKKVI